MAERQIAAGAGSKGAGGDPREQPVDSQAEDAPFLELSPREAREALPHLPWLPSFFYAGGGAVLAFSVSWFWYPVITSALVRDFSVLLPAILSGEGILTGVIPGAVGVAAVHRARMLMRRRAAERAVGAGSRADAEVTSQLADLGALPEEIAGPLQQALAAYRAMVDLAGDPGWRRARVPVGKHVGTARSQLLVLMGRARRMLRVRGALLHQEGSASLPQLDEVRQLYETHCEKLASAAAMFEQVQVSLARALLALTDRPGVAPEAPLHDMAASLTASKRGLGRQAPGEPGSRRLGPVGNRSRRCRGGRGALRGVPVGWPRG